MVRLILWLWLRLQTLLQLSNGRAIKGCRWKDPRLEGATIETGAIAVEPLAKNLTTTNDAWAMAVVKGGEFGLSEAKGEESIVAGRHFVVWVVEWSNVDWFEVLFYLF
jgi:hypothetical protein